MINIQKIETFLYAAENSSLSEAAKQLHLSQPAVSHQIKSLEQELGVKLFIRCNIGIISKKRGSHKTAMPNTPRKSKEWLFFPYLAGLKNSYPEILRRYQYRAKNDRSR
jgi:DNA-binding transcriptional ArsR family regulator